MQLKGDFVLKTLCSTLKLHFLCFQILMLALPSNDFAILNWRDWSLKRPSWWNELVSVGCQSGRAKSDVVFLQQSHFIWLLNGQDGQNAEQQLAIFGKNPTTALLGQLIRPKLYCIIGDNPDSQRPMLLIRVSTAFHSTETDDTENFNWDWSADVSFPQCLWFS